ncbi:carbohydrate ABC transporter permease [Thermopolyspora sp. NPDC052614]|uniref:carbohydrate ABC transporter permease n=1 Tax=Thermopolyspora sp. NPDC052614 TaxID=3155682 RepID=UPI0034454812
MSGSPTTLGGRSAAARVLTWVLAAIILAWTVVPLAWMLLSSFKPESAIKTTTPTLVFTPTLDNYGNLFGAGNDITPFMVNSVIATVTATALALVLGTLAGYGLARWHGRGRRHLAFWIISTRMAPIAAVILPLFIMFRYLGLLDSVAGLILAYLSFSLPFAIWLMSAFFADVPRAIEEAALVEGATRWQAFWHVVLPTTKPGLVTTAVLCAVFSWNDYAFASSFSGPSSQTLPMAAGRLITQGGIDWGQLTALGVVVTLPMIIAGLAVRRWLVTGLTLGAVTAE